MELFRTIYGTNYSVSNTGKVRSNTKHTVLKDSPSWNGYRRVSLSLGKRGLKAGFQVHRLVAEYFIDNPENKPEVNHKDADKTNNTVSNLEWVTKEENTAHAVEKGLMISFKGEKHGCAKLTHKQVECIRGSTLNTKEVARLYNVSVRTIQKIKSGKSWLN